jgi:NADPH-dependent 2,4-dienoyl-CoA reductase/sulfur reductase-like enzyme
MEAARVMALRGHRVVLYEKRAQLGGQINLAVIPPHKEELQSILDYLGYQLEKLKVRTCMETEATADTVAKEKPDAVTLATGARPLIPEIPGLPGERLFTPEEVLQQRRPMGEKVLVIGGGVVGCEVAEYLADRGKRVTIVEKLPEIAPAMDSSARRLLLERLGRLSVRMITGAEVFSFEGEKAILLQKGEKVYVETEAIVAAMGATAELNREEFQSCGVPVYAVGDCAGVRDIAAAIQEGFAAAMRI